MRFNTMENKAPLHVPDLRGWMRRGNTENKQTDIIILDCGFGLVGRYQVSEKHTVSIFSPKDTDSIFLRNVGILL
jgi:hypothetical protein